MLMMFHVFNRTVVFPADLTGSHGEVITAAGAQANFDIQKNGASVGTMRFEAAGAQSSFIAGAQQVYAAGDIIKVIAPSPADSTLSGLTFTLAGSR
jgi:hypothetical protein